MARPREQRITVPSVRPANRRRTHSFELEIDLSRGNGEAARNRLRGFWCILNLFMIVHGKRDGITLAQLRKFRCRLNVLMVILFLMSLAHIFSNNVVGRSTNPCFCKHGVALTEACHSRSQTACAYCDTGYTLSFPAWRGTPVEIGEICRPTACLCADGKPIIGKGCPKDNAIRCVSCNPGFELLHGIVCHAASQDFYMAGGLAGKTPLNMYTSDFDTDGALTSDFDGRRFSGERSATRINDFQGEPLNMHTSDFDTDGALASDFDGRRYSGGRGQSLSATVDEMHFHQTPGPQPPSAFTQGFEKQLQALERSVDQNSKKIGELQRLTSKGIALANPAGFVRNTPFIRSEGGKDKDCIDKVDEAFDQASGWVDFQTLCIFDAAFAKRAGTCVGKSLRANVLDISFENFSQVPERLTMASCIKQFLRGYRETQTLETLESFDTSGNAIWFGDIILAESIFSRFPRLSKLNVGNNDLKADTASRILSQLGSLESLDMSGNLLGNMCGQRKLGHTLSRLPRLSKLNLARNRLNAETADEILSPLTSLESLDVSNNRIYLENRLQLGHTLSRFPRLSMINLGKNRLNEQDICYLFCSSLRLPTLRRLLLSVNFLREIASFGASIVNTMPAIEELNLSSNLITGQNVVEFIGVLRTNSSLLVLDLNDNCISPDMAVKISAAAQRLPRLRISGLDYQHNVTSVYCNM